MQQKIIIGIDIDPYLKKTITKSLKKWRDLPVRWHKEESLHIALFKLGWVGEEDVLDINAALAEFCADTDSFSVDFEKIISMSRDPKKTDISEAQIVRLTGGENEQMRVFYKELAEILALPISENNTFKPYVNLGRMRAHQWKDMEEYPEMEIGFPVTMDVSAITLFESAQIDGKRQLIPVEVFELQ